MPFSVYVDGQSVDLSHWANEQQAELKTFADAGGKDDLVFSWSDDANALVNMSEHIILKRVNVADAEQADGMHPENWAYAWEEGVSETERKRVVWQKYEYRDSNNVLIKDEGWVSIDLIDGNRKIWNKGSWDNEKAIVKNPLVIHRLCR